MAQEFYIRGWKSTEFSLLPISELEYEEIKRAKNNILAVVSIEDKFDLLLENFIELECELLALSQRCLLRMDRSWSVGQLETQVLNRRVLNLLSSARLYVDFLNATGKDLDHAGLALPKTLTEARSTLYDNKLGYRAMETIRNYTQHCSTPIHELRSGGTWETSTKGEFLVEGVVPLINVSELHAWARSHASASGRKTVAELQNIGQLIPATPLVREYLEGLAELHEQLRVLIVDPFSKWENTYYSAWAMFNRTHGTNLNTVTIVATESGQLVESDDIFEDLCSHRQAFVAKNCIFTRLSKRYVSGYCELRGYL